MHKYFILTSHNCFYTLLSQDAQTDDLCHNFDDDDDDPFAAENDDDEEEEEYAPPPATPLLLLELPGTGSSVGMGRPSASAFSRSLRIVNGDTQICGINYVSAITTSAPFLRQLTILIQR